MYPYLLHHKGYMLQALNLDDTSFIFHLKLET